MKYRIKPYADFYSIERLERRKPFKPSQWVEVTRVSIFDRRFVLPLVPKSERDKLEEEKMPVENAKHALKVLDEIKKADAIVEGKQ